MTDELTLNRIVGIAVGVDLKYKMLFVLIFEHTLGSFHTVLIDVNQGKSRFQTAKFLTT